MQRIAVTGATGYLASLVMRYNSDRFEFVPVSRKDVDYQDLDAVRAYFRDLDFDLMFHTAANATTADCENDPAGTHRVNCEAAIEIARVCRERGARLLFISTEQLYNGLAVPGPHAEDVDPLPVTNYGRHKAEVEQWMTNNLDDYVVLRLSWMFGMAMPRVKPSPGIVGNVLRALAADTPTLFTVNEMRCMTYAQHLADSFAQVCALPSGIYHFASANDLCTYDAALLVGRKLVDAGLFDAARVERCIVPNTERYADRFRDFRLNSTKLADAGIKLGTFESDVARCLADFGW